jgi:hypothetical protein
MVPIGAVITGTGIALGAKVVSHGAFSGTTLTVTLDKALTASTAAGNYSV